MVGLTRVAAKEFGGGRAIRVNAIAPGSIETPLMVKAQAVYPEAGKNLPGAFKRMGTSEEMASLIAFLLGPESSYITGAVYSADGGWAC